MAKKQIQYYKSGAAELERPEHLVRFTYSFNNVERTVTGEVHEWEDRIYLFEYRDKYIGSEFFISFSKESVSYKLIKVEEPVEVA